MPTKNLAKALLQANIQQTQAIRGTVQRFAQGQFYASGAYRTADQARFIDQVAPVVLAGRQQASQLTAAYLNQIISDATGKRSAIRSTVDPTMIRGVDVADVYARPYEQVWYSLSQGATLDSAVSAGMARLNTLINSDMQLSKTQTSQDILSNSPDSVIGYERILGGDASCALCIIASTQRYHRDDLMPIHNNCNCDVGPIIDTGKQIIYPERLSSAHDMVEELTGNFDPSARDVGLGFKTAGGKGADYANIMITHNHGELGPTIAFRGTPFVGPNDLTAAK